MCRDDGQSARMVAGYRDSWRKAVDKVPMTKSPDKLMKEWVENPLIGTLEYPIRISNIMMSSYPDQEDFERVFAYNTDKGKLLPAPD